MSRVFLIGYLILLLPGRREYENEDNMNSKDQFIILKQNAD